jgi:hypothetical protein
MVVLVASQDYLQVLSGIKEKLAEQHHRSERFGSTKLSLTEK